ncbi:putative Acylphosphatase-like domain-containing protein [Septoria linicola]|nr:putative Acylphosphatase-like domain-containing protein [Septoria linicola]
MSKRVFAFLFHHLQQQSPLKPLQISFKVEGTVQGVNFRSFTAEKAQSLSLTGFVKNANDGSVVGEAQGSSSNLDKFVQHLNMGPRAASVSKVDQKDIETKEGEGKFEQ